MLQRGSFVLLILNGILAAGRLIADEPPADFVIGYMGVGRDGPGLHHALGFIKPDGNDEVLLDFHRPEQVSWVFGPQFRQSNRIVLTSFEESDVTKVRSGRALSHNWIFDRHSGELTELFQKNRPAEQMRTYALLHDDSRAIVSGIIDGEERLFEMNLDGSEQTALTEPGSGFHYGLALSSDERRLALHVTGGRPSFYNPGAYAINVLDLPSRQRTLIAGQPGHLYFGPRWSPDEHSLVYLDCLHDKDPQHFAAALCVGQADGSGQRRITPPQSQWFGTPFGSNMSEWSPDGTTVTYTRLRDGSDATLQQGGAQICLINPVTDVVTELTESRADRWDFRPAWSPDGKQLTFTRLEKGGTRELWIMQADGSQQQRLTRGHHDRGADYARWFRATTETLR